MKKTIGLGVLLALTTFFASLANATPVSYYYSGPVSGWMEVGLNPASSQGTRAGFNVTYGTVTETLNYDPSAQTLEEVGFVTLNPPSTSGTFNLLGSYVGNPITGGGYPVVGSATLTVGNNGMFSFDYTYSLTGKNPVNQNLGILMPVSGTANYLGQRLSGSWNLIVPAYPVVLAASPSSLTFIEGGAGNEWLLPGPAAMPGLVAGDYNDTYYSSWYVSGVATAVPDSTRLITSAPLILLFGSSAWRMLRKRQMASPHVVSGAD